MKITIDTDTKALQIEDQGKTRNLDLYSKESFEIISRQWLRVGWDQKYQYSFSWLGRPIIQLPEDMLRMQEVIYTLKPDVIVETGIAHGGSLIFYASLCKLIGKGRVIGIDIDIRPHNRKALENHPLFPLLAPLEGSSTDPSIVSQIKQSIKPGETVLVILDSSHTYAHVLAELKAYAPLVSKGSYIVATDGLMFDLHDVPRGQADWAQNNPMRAAADFAAQNPNFIIEQPGRIFNESKLKENISHWPGAWVKRIA